ncbi:MAG: PTS sugar transporter subunit IIB [Erysipelotrichaceae bacterium]|jgi:mannose/fructose/N-acetylgalactosamine-specific phosphotransferase system component IIB|nr:PTS sugar transporter subunit IIB [Erysipelotrichaceae bacterium]
MKISVLRIDDRLIHGQIVTRWVSYANAKTILVADDKAAKDATLQMLLKLAVPSGVTLKIASIEEAAKAVSESTSDEKILLITRNPAETLRLLQLGVSVPSINVGNISNSKSEVGRKKMLDYIYFEPQDANALQKIAEMNVALDVRAIPDESSKDGLSLVKKYLGG